MRLRTSQHALVHAHPRLHLLRLQAPRWKPRRCSFAHAHAQYSCARSQVEAKEAGVLTRLSAAITVGTIAFGDESATIVPNATPGPGESVVELQVEGSHAKPLA